MFNGATDFKDTYDVGTTPAVTHFKKRRKIVDGETKEYYNIDKLIRNGYNIKYNNTELNSNNNRGTGNVTKFKRVITENANIHSFSVESKEIVDSKTFGLVKIKALKSDGSELTGITGLTNDEDKIYVEFENDDFDADSDKKYLIYKYDDDTREILDEQPSDYPVVAEFIEGSSNTIYAYLTGLSTIGAVEDGSVPCPCFHEDTELLCYNPETKQEYYEKTKNIKENETYLKVENNSEGYMKVFKHDIIYCSVNNKPLHELFHNHKQHKDIKILGGHRVFENNKKVAVCKSDNYELLDDNKDVQKIHLIKLHEKEVYIIYLKHNIKTLSC